MSGVLALLADVQDPAVSRWAAELSRRGWEVHVLSLQMGGIPGVEVHALMPRLAGQLGKAMLARQVRGLVDHLHPDVVHVFGGSLYGALARPLADYPLIVSVSDEDVRILHHWEPFRRRELLRILGEADRLITPSHAMAHMVGTQLPGPKPEVIPFGVDLAHFTPGEEPEVPTIGCTLPLEADSGLEYLICALRLIVQRNPNRPLRLLLGGEGDERDALDALSRELAMATRTSLVGFIPPDERPKFLRGLTIYVMPVLRDLDGFAQTAMEAASCALPVVSSWVGGLGEVVLDEVNGLLVPPKDPDLLADAIERLLDDASLRTEMGANGRALIRTSYDWRQNVARMEALYQEIADQQPRAHDYLID